MLRVRRRIYGLVIEYAVGLSEDETGTFRVLVDSHQQVWNDG